MDDDSRSAAPPTMPLNGNLLDLISGTSLENRAQGWISDLPLPVTISPLGVESSHGASLLSDYGKFARAHVDDGNKWAVELTVDDVSYCKQSAEISQPRIACGPGYATSNNDVAPGIQPYLS